MTDTSTTTRFASPAVLRHLRQVPAAQRNWYLAQGEPQCLSGDYMIDGEAKTQLHPGLRGIRVGGVVETPEAAVAAAAAFKADLLDGPLDPFDEIRAGIDGEATSIQERFGDSGARMERIVHIGSMLDGSDDLAEALDDIVADILHGRSRRRPAAPLLETVDPEAAERPADVPEVANDLPLLSRLADMGRMTRSELLDEFGALAHDDGAMGFLVQISVPLYVPHKNGGASVHGGQRRVCWRYASTYAIAAERALDWADAEIARMWPGRKAA